MLLAVILICATSVSPDACTRATALDVLVQPEPSLFACMAAGQGIPARDGLAPDTYAKTVCEPRRGS